MKRTIGLALAALVLGALPAIAQNYPSREIKVIVPFPAGGPSDIVARIAAEAMSKHLGHNLLIENVGGAGGTIGATRAAESAGDGYTLFAASMGTIIVGGGIPGAKATILQQSGQAEGAITLGQTEGSAGAFMLLSAELGVALQSGVMRNVREAQRTTKNCAR